MVVLPLTNDNTRQAALDKSAEIAFRHAASAMSMEDSPDQLPVSPWILAHEAYGFEGSPSLQWTSQYGPLGY